MIDLSKYDDVLTINVRGNTIPLYRFIERFLWIIDKDDRLVPFKLNFVQRKLYEDMCLQKISPDYRHNIRFNLLKGRQMGMSTFIAGIFFCYAMYLPNSRWIVLADQKEHASNIFKKYETFYKYLNHSLGSKLEDEILRYPLDHDGERHPDDLRPTLKTVRKGQKLETEFGNSSIEVITQGDTAGRGSTYTGIHSSETAFQADIKSTIVSLFQTVSEDNPNSMIFLETTANGFNEYKDLWDIDSRGDTKFIAEFLPWYLDSSYKAPLPSNKRLPLLEPWLYDRLHKHPSITQEQAMWYWSKYKDLKCSSAFMLQEYPFDPIDAFATSGKSIFAPDLIQKRINECLTLKPKVGTFEILSTKWSTDGNKIDITLGDFLEESLGHWKIYSMPLKGRPYVVICDPNKGIGIDYSAIQVIDNINAKQVAVYKSKDDELIDVAKQLYAVGKFYNDALISVEANTGPYINEALLKMNYPNIYVSQTQIYEDYQQKFAKKFGHMTTPLTRPKMITDLATAFKNDPQIISDIDTLKEMETFQNIVKTINGVQKIKAQASGANHDDLVMSYAPFWTVRIQQTTIDDISKRSQSTSIDDSEDERLRRLEYKVQENKRKLALEKEKVYTNNFGIKF